MNPLQLYDAGLRGDAVITVRMSDGTVAPLAIGRYLGAAGPIDESLLHGVRGPVIDVGCGPGRMLHALARRGVFALGVDLSPAAVDLARGGGGRAIVADVFDELPGAGTWQTALLLDGNIGIGGAPDRLLARIEALLAPGGELICELDAPEAPTGPVAIRLEHDELATQWFAWARVASAEVPSLAASVGFTVRRIWSSHGRWFARLASRT